MFLKRSLRTSKKKSVFPDDLYLINEEGQKCSVELVPNQFIILRADQSDRKTQLGRFDGEKVIPLAYRKRKPYGVTPRNVGQHFLQEALMTDASSVPLVIVRGGFSQPGGQIAEKERPSVCRTHGNQPENIG